MDDVSLGLDVQMTGPDLPCFTIGRHQNHSGQAETVGVVAHAPDLEWLGLFGILAHTVPCTTQHERTRKKARLRLALISLRLLVAALKFWESPECAVPVFQVHRNLLGPYVEGPVTTEGMEREFFQVILQRSSEVASFTDLLEFQHGHRNFAADSADKRVKGDIPIYSLKESVGLKGVKGDIPIYSLKESVMSPFEQLPTYPQGGLLARIPRTATCQHFPTCTKAERRLRPFHFEPYGLMKPKVLQLSEAKLAIVKKQKPLENGENPSLSVL